MAKLPGPAQLSAPRPTLGAPRASVSGIGSAMRGMGSVVGEIAQREKQKFDTTKVEDAYNQLQETQLDLTLGEENGFTNRKSGDALEGDMLGEYTKRLEQKRDALMANLSPDQQKMFGVRAGNTLLQFREDILRHNGKQREVHEDEVFDGSLAVESQKASTRPGDLVNFLAGQTRLDALINQRAEARDLGAEGKALLRQQTLSPYYAAVIQAALDNDDTETVDKLLKLGGDFLDPDVVSRAKGGMEAVGDAAEAQSIVDENYIPDASPSQMEKTLREVRAKYKDKPKLRDDAIARLKVRYNEDKAFDNDRQKDLTKRAWRIAMTAGSPAEAHAALSADYALLAELDPSVTGAIQNWIQAKAEKEARGLVHSNRAAELHLDGLAETGSLDSEELARWEPLLNTSDVQKYEAMIEKDFQVDYSTLKNAYLNNKQTTLSKLTRRQKADLDQFIRWSTNEIEKQGRPKNMMELTDRWFLEGRSLEDDWGVDPTTFGGSVIKQRTDFAVDVPEESLDSVKGVLKWGARIGIESDPESKDDRDNFYALYYLPAQQHLSRMVGVAYPVQLPDGRFAKVVVEMSDLNLAATSALLATGKIVTPANVLAMAQQIKGK
jgi:hypothetical protein